MQTGDNIPETGVTVVSSQGQRLVRSLIAGQKQQLKVVQKLCWMGAHSPAAPPATASGPAAAAAAGGSGAGEGAAVAPEATQAKAAGRKTMRRKMGKTAKAAAAAVAAEDKENRPEATAGEEATRTTTHVSASYTTVALATKTPFVVLHHLSGCMNPVEISDTDTLWLSKIRGAAWL